MRIFYDPYGTGPEMKGLGAWVATPGYILERIRSLGAEYEVVGKELRSQIDPCLPDGSDRDSAACVAKMKFVSSVWTPLKASWGDFYSNHQAWYNRLWGATVDVIDEYVIRLRNVRTAAEKVGFSFQSPAPPLPQESSWSKLGSTIRFVVIGGAVIGGLFIVYRLLPSRAKGLTSK